MKIKKTLPEKTHETKPVHFFENKLVRTKAKEINNELTVVRDLEAM